MNTSVGNRARAISHGDLQLFLEHYLIGNAHVFQPVKEVKHLLRDILLQQGRWVLVLTLVIVGLRFCVKVSCGQLGIGHIEGLCWVNSLFFPQSKFAGKITLPQIVQLVSCVYIMLAVKNDFIKFLLSERPVDVKTYRCFSNIHPQVRFNGFQG